MRTIYPFVMLEQIVTEQVTKSGIILGYQKGQSELLRNDIYPIMGIVRYVPKEIEEVKVGECVIYLRFNSRDIGDGCIVVRLQDILAKVEDKNE